MNRNILSRNRVEINSFRNAFSLIPGGAYRSFSIPIRMCGQKRKRQFVS